MEFAGCQARKSTSRLQRLKTDLVAKDKQWSEYQRQSREAYMKEQRRQRENANKLKAEIMEMENIVAGDHASVQKASANCFLDQ